MSCGVLLLDKPLGMSSSAATQRVRRLLRVAKAGHVGSLDPLATGMLPICIGEATKLAGEILEGRKTYAFRVALGVQTATGDVEGEPVALRAVPELKPEHLATTLERFCGESLQVPPMYSALKRDGRPLYQLARAGLTVERAARPIFIHALQLLDLGADWLDCRVVCGKGTYVRTLAEDIARALGTCGHVAVLRREAVEPFDTGRMIPLAQLETELLDGRLPPLMAADRAVGHLAAVELDSGEARRIGLGQTVVRSPGDLPAASADAAAEADVTVRLYSPESVFLGLGRVGPGGRLQPKRLFVPEP